MHRAADLDSVEDTAYNAALQELRDEKPMTSPSLMGSTGNLAALSWLPRAGKLTFLILQLSLVVTGCTIYEFNGSGFAANAFAIAHMVPIFHNTNGTFFLDNTKNHYKCSAEGGWHDFFGWEDQVRSWLVLLVLLETIQHSDALPLSLYTWGASSSLLSFPGLHVGLVALQSIRAKPQTAVPEHAASLRWRLS